MRVLILSYFYPPEIGAPGQRLQAITQAFTRRGWSVDVITGMPQYPLGRTFPGYRGRLWRRETLLGARVYRVFTYPTQRLGIHRLTSYLSHAVGAIVFGTLRWGRWDVVFVESPPLFVGLPGLWLSAAKGARLVLDVTDLWPDSARELGLVRSECLLRWGAALERALYGRAWRIACATEGIAHRLSAEKGVPSEKIDVLRNGVDPAVFAPGGSDGDWLKELGLEGRTLFTYAGRHGYAQGLRVILEAARLLRGEPDIAFLLVGDGPTKQELMSEAAAERLENVRFLSAAPAEQAARVLAASYATIAPLRGGTLMAAAVPSKIITSLSAGAPVIFCGKGETAELLATRACGLVVEPEQPDQLARAIRWLRDHPRERAAFSRNGVSLVQQAYRWDQITDRWLAGWSSVTSP